MADIRSGDYSFADKSRWASERLPAECGQLRIVAPQRSSGPQRESGNADGIAIQSSSRKSSFSAEIQSSRSKPGCSHTCLKNLIRAFSERRWDDIPVSILTVSIVIRNV